jgi:hypothetical protein
LPICFTDNDFLWKLVVFNLFHEALESLGITQNDVRVLPQAKYVLKKRCKEEHVQKVLSALEPLICLEVTPEDAIILESLTQDPSINVGEARLIAKTLQTPCSILATGDKRMIRGLGNPHKHLTIREQLQGKIICLEQAVLAVIDNNKYGFEYVKSRVVPVRDGDTAIKVVFGSGDKSTYRNCIQALKSYIEELHRESNGLLKKSLNLVQDVKNFQSANISASANIYPGVLVKMYAPSLLD